MLCKRVAGNNFTLGYPSWRSWCGALLTPSSLCQDELQESYNLIKDLEPTVPQEYILKGVVNAAMGQETGSVRCVTY